MTRARRGFALMTVLWLMVAASVAALATTLAAREAVDTAVNRANAERALWRANDCLERERAAVDIALAAAHREDDVLEAWTQLDRRAGLALADECNVTLVPAGSRLDVNSATVEQLRRVFAGVGLMNADTLADALRDWIDVDDDPGHGGAERDWYVERGRLTPRNGPLADLRELQRVAGFEHLLLDSVLTVDSSRIAINAAPLAVLAALPGFTEDVLQQIANDRSIGRGVRDFAALAASVPRRSADSILANYPDLVRLSTIVPDAWIARAHGWAGSPAISAFVEARLVLGGNGRAAMLRRRRLP